MTRTLLLAAVPLALLCGCGTPMVWQGPAGTGQQELSDVKRECLSRTEARREYNEQLYQQTVTQPEITSEPGAPGDFYRTGSRQFDRCMVAQGYKLVPRQP